MIANKVHNQKVKGIQAQIRSFQKNGQKARIFHGGTYSTRHSDDEGKYINISNLDEIIEVNIKNNYVITEPNVSLEKLLNETLKYGLIPPVVSEFPAITVGGAIQGGAGESSSFRWGVFHETCLEHEALLGNGERMTCSPQKHKELFNALGCSMGTIGVITLSKLRLIPAEQYVRVDYLKVGSVRQAVSIINKYSEDKNTDYIDGIMFSKNSGVVMVGRHSGYKSGLPISTFHKATDEWFFRHAKSMIEKGKTSELIPIKDYLFRYNRGAFWMGAEGLKLFKLPFIRFMSITFAYLFITERMYRYLHNANLSQRFLVQDICLPRDKVVEFISFIHNQIKVYPLWLCPLRPNRRSLFSPNNIKTELVINVGVWSLLAKDEEYLEINRKLENKVDKLGGRKVLYAHTYYPLKQFWQIYNEGQYEKDRTAYKSNVVFPDIYSKVKVTQRYQPAILKGLLRYLLVP